jgi:hypothetical protein
MSIFSRLLKREQETTSPPLPGDQVAPSVTDPHPVPEPPRTELPPSRIVLPRPVPLLADRDWQPGALPSREFPPSAEETRPYSWSGPQRRPSALGVIAAEPAVSAAAIDQAFRKLVAAAETGLLRSGAGSAWGKPPASKTAAQAMFEELAYQDMAPLRNLILEIGWGEARIAWIGMVRPVLRSLRGLAAKINLLELTAALDDFTRALDRAADGGQSPLPDGVLAAVIEAYQPLACSLPGAFAVEAEQARREPLILESLLLQVPDIDPLMFARLSVPGLRPLVRLLRATKAEIVRVAGVPAVVAESVIQRVKDFQRCAPAILGADASLSRRSLEPLLGRLQVEHRCFERAASGWTEEDLAAKRRARTERERAYLALRAALARLGAVDQVLAFDKLAFRRRLEEIADFVREGETTAASSPPPPSWTSKGGQADGRADP